MYIRRNLTIKLFITVVFCCFFRFFWKKSILLFSKDTLNCSKVTVKTFIMLQKISVSNKCCSLELSINQRILKKKMYQFPQNILGSTTDFNIDNNQKCFKIQDFYLSHTRLYREYITSSEMWVSWAANQHIRMISEDHVTRRLEEWCWKYSFDHSNQLHFNAYSHPKQPFKIVIIFHIFTVFWSNKCSFGEQKSLLSKTLQNINKTFEQ